MAECIGVWVCMCAYVCACLLFPFYFFFACLTETPYQSSLPPLLPSLHTQAPTYTPISRYQSVLAIEIVYRQTCKGSQIQQQKRNKVKRREQIKHTPVSHMSIECPTTYFLSFLVVLLLRPLKPMLWKWLLHFFSLFFLSYSISFFSFLLSLFAPLFAFIYPFCVLVTDSTRRHTHACVLARSSLTTNQLARSFTWWS